MKSDQLQLAQALLRRVTDTRRCLAILDTVMTDQAAQAIPAEVLILADARAEVARALMPILTRHVATLEAQLKEMGVEP